MSWYRFSRHKVLARARHGNVKGYSSRHRSSLHTEATSFQSHLPPLVEQDVELFEHVAIPNGRSTLEYARNGHVHDRGIEIFEDHPDQANSSDRPSAVRPTDVESAVGIEPDHLVAVIQSYMDLHPSPEVESLSRYMATKGIAPSLSYCTVLVAALTAVDRLTEAEQVLWDLHVRGNPLDLDAVKPLVKAYCRSKQLEKAETLVLRLKDAGVEASGQIVHLLLHAFKVEHDFSKMSQWLHLMETWDLFPAEESWVLLLITLFDEDCEGPGCDSLLQFVRRSDIGLHRDLFDLLSQELSVARAWRVMRRMHDAGMPVNRAHVLYAVRQLCEADEWQLAEEAVRTMQTLGIPMDRITCRDLICVYSRAGQLQKAEMLLEEGHTQGVEADWNGVAALVKAYCQQQELGRASQLLHRVQQWGSLHSPVIHNALIDAYCENQMLQDAHRVMQRMEDDGLAADLWTFKNLVQGHCKASHWVGVQEILSAMQARGLQPDTGMFNTIMLQQCRDNSPEGAKQAQVVFQTMDAHGVAANIITYQGLIKSYCRQGELRHAEGILEQMQVKGLQPDAVMQKHFLLGYCQHGELERAELLLMDMIAKEQELLPEHFGILIIHCHRNRLWTKVREWMDRALSVDKVPGVKSFNCTLYACCRMEDLEGARSLLDYMTTHGLQPTIYTYTTLLHCYVSEGLLHEAESIFGSIHEVGLEPADVTYNLMCLAYVKAQNLPKVVQLWDEMQQRGHKLDMPVVRRIIQMHVDLQCTGTQLQWLLQMMQSSDAPLGRDDYHQLLSLCSGTHFDASALRQLYTTMARANGLYMDVISLRDSNDDHTRPQSLPPLDAKALEAVRTALASSGDGGLPRAHLEKLTAWRRDFLPEVGPLPQFVERHAEVLAWTMVQKRRPRGSQRLEALAGAGALRRSRHRDHLRKRLHDGQRDGPQKPRLEGLAREPREGQQKGARESLPDAAKQRQSLAAYCKAGKLKQAARLLTEMIATDQLLLPDHFAVLILHCHKQRLWAQVRHWMDRALESQAALPATLFNCAVTACCKLEDLEGAHRLITRMNDCALKPDRDACTHLLICQAVKGLPYQDVVQTMDAQGLAPEITTYNALVKNYCRKGNLRNAEGLVADMREKGLRPDATTQKHLLKSYCANGEMDRAEKLLQQAFAARQELLPVHFGFLVGEYHKQGLWAKVREWMDMALESKQVMEVMDFNAAIHACCKLDDVEGARRILSSMEAHHVPTLYTYTILLQFYASNGLLREGETMFHNLREFGLKPDAAAYHIMCQAYVTAGDVRQLVEMMDEMQQQGHVPRRPLVNSVLKMLTEVRCTGAQLHWLLKLMQSSGYRLLGKEHRILLELWKAECHDLSALQQLQALVQASDLHMQVIRMRMPIPSRSRSQRCSTATESEALDTICATLAPCGSHGLPYSRLEELTAWHHKFCEAVGPLPDFLARHADLLDWWFTAQPDQRDAGTATLASPVHRSEPPPVQSGDAMQSSAHAQPQPTQPRPSHTLAQSVPHNSRSSTSPSVALSQSTKATSSPRRPFPSTSPPSSSQLLHTATARSSLAFKPNSTQRMLGSCDLEAASSLLQYWKPVLEARLACQPLGLLNNCAFFSALGVWSSVMGNLLHTGHVYFAEGLAMTCIHQFAQSKQWPQVHNVLTMARKHNMQTRNLLPIYQKLKAAYPQSFARPIL